MIVPTGESRLKGPLRVLVVEDSEDDYQLLLRELRKGGYEPMTQRVETADAMVSALEQKSWDAVFSDWAMPSFSAAGALEVLTRTGIDLPFIIISGTVGEDVAVEALRRGAHDFMVKDKLARLLPAIERELREAKNRRERVRMQEHLLVSDRMASVGILAAGVAHEINNPLAAILTNLELAVQEVDELVKARPESARLRELLNEISDSRESAERIRSIVRDLKVLSRSEEETCSPVDVHRVLESSVKIAWNEIRHRARLVKDFQPVPPVLANQSRLGQVFLNLIVNAAQAIPEGKVDKNEIRVRTSLGRGGRVLIEVSDTGSGMESAVLKRLFTPFFTTKAMGAGTGLGLSICHRIITALGGDITVESALGVGSTFRVQLPAATGTPVVAERPASSPSKASRRGRVMVIDDEPALLAAVKRLLAQDHDVVALPGAKEALAMLTQGEEFDVILCDLMMPEMTGMDLHEALVNAAPELAAKMIFLTGGAFSTRARAFLDQAANLHIEKPFDGKALRAIVDGRVG